MVVSGVPRENGILHASEIASMALDLVGVCRTFRIPHKPNTQLQIRAGIHSGTHTYKPACTQFIAHRKLHNVSMWFQVRWWLVWLGLKCRGTVCLEIQSTQPPEWNQPAWVSWTLNSVVCTGCDNLTVSSALKIQCSSTAFYLMEECGGYVLECRGSLQVKVSRISRPLSVSGSTRRHSLTLSYLSKGKGDMVTYWLEGKRNHKETSPDANSSKQSAMETKLEGEPFALLPGFLNEDLLLEST